MRGSLVKQHECALPLLGRRKDWAIAPTDSLQMGAILPFKRALAVSTANKPIKPAYAVFKNPNFSTVHAAGLGLSSRNFQSPRLKLTPISCLTPLLGCLQLLEFSPLVVLFTRQPYPRFDRQGPHM